MTFSVISAILILTTLFLASAQVALPVTRVFLNTSSQSSNRQLQSISPFLAKNNFDMAYTVTVSIGSPSVVFNLKLDTTSPIIWVVDQSAVASNDPTRYSSTFSGSEIVVAYNQQSTYLDGAVTGTLYGDLVTLGSLSVPKQRFISASTVTINSNSYFDGYFGLGFTQGSGAHAFTSNVFNGNQIPAMQFSLFLSDHNTSTVTDASFILGGYDQRYMTGYTFNFFPITTTGSSPAWTLSLTSWSFGSTNLASSQSNVLISTSTYYSTIPSYYWNSFVQAIQQSMPTCVNTAGILTCPCPGSSSSSLPSISIQFSTSEVFTIPASSYLYPTSAATCTVTVISSSNSQWVLGQNFLRSYYTLFDMTNQKIGFAPANQNWQSSASKLTVYSNSNSSNSGSSAGAVAAAIIVPLVALLVAGCIINGEWTRHRNFKYTRARLNRDSHYHHDPGYNHVEMIRVNNPVIYGQPVAQPQLAQPYAQSYGVQGYGVQGYGVQGYGQPAVYSTGVSGGYGQSQPHVIVINQ